MIAMLVPSTSNKGFLWPPRAFPPLFQGGFVAPARVIPWDGPLPPDIIVDAAGHSFCSLCHRNVHETGQAHPNSLCSVDGGAIDKDKGIGIGKSQGEKDGLQLLDGVTGGNDGHVHKCGVAGHDQRASHLEQFLLDNYPPRKVVRFAPAVEHIPNAPS